MWDLSASRIDHPIRVPQTRRGLPGFTLTEALVGMVILVILMFGVYLVYDTSQATFWRGAAKVDIQQEARSALERMRQELRNAGYDPSGTGQAGVKTTTSTILEFITDADDNNLSDLVKYDRDSTAKTLRRTVKAWTGSDWSTSSSVTTLATHVDSLAFEYFPSSSSPKRIRITIQTLEKVPTQPTQTHSVSTDVFLRNL